MATTANLLEHVLSCLHPGDDVITAARARLNEVLKAASRFDSCLRTYRSGSIAHRTANFDTDADGGIVLDRRRLPELGPDGEGVGPSQIVDAVRRLVHDELAPSHPRIRFRVTKRAIQIIYNEPVAEGVDKDPSVDLIVALTRRSEPGLWIPNIEQDRWDPSHPERHTDLLTDEPKALRQKRARVIRLAKGWNAAFSKPAVCSFNIEALALQSVEHGMGPTEALAIFFENAAADLKRRRTLDPAGVSPPIKTLIDRQDAAERFRRAGVQLREALTHDSDECAVRAALSKLFADHVDLCESDIQLRDALPRGGRDFTIAGTLASGSTQSRQRTTHAYGGEP